MDPRSQRDSARLEEAMATWHNVAVHFVLYEAIAKTLNTIEAERRRGIWRSVTRGSLHGEGAPTGSTFLTNAARWTTYKPREAGLFAKTCTAKLRTTSGARLDQVQTRSRPTTSTRGTMD